MRSESSSPDMKPSSPDMKPSEVLERAHDVIVERGWCQNRFEDAEGRVCALGAVGVAVDSPFPWLPFAGQFDTYAGAESFLFREAGGPASRYNDHPGASKEDVLLLFKRAAERARLEGR